MPTVVLQVGHADIIGDPGATDSVKPHRHVIRARLVLPTVVPCIKFDGVASETGAAHAATVAANSPGVPCIIENRERESICTTIAAADVDIESNVEGTGIPVLAGVRERGTRLAVALRRQLNIIMDPLRRTAEAPFRPLQLQARLL
jgi:hypothetical protein